MKKIGILLMMIISNCMVFAIDKVSIEVDALPYIIGKNYFGIGVAEKGINYRMVKANVNLPNFILSDTIDSVNMDVFTVIIDYYFEEESYQGPWVGVGYELWNSEITEEVSNIKNNLKQNIFTLGGGYLYKLNEHFYINPWVAIHYDLSNNSEKLVGSTLYKPNKVTPEASLKFGYQF